MDKTAFLDLLQRYATTSVEDAQALVALRAKYPYSQLLQTLAARASKDHGFQHQQRDLQFAAVYAADRNLLKNIITGKAEERVEQIVSKHVDANKQAAATIDSVDVADVIMDDLEQLSRLKHTFENLYMDRQQAAKAAAGSDEAMEVKHSPSQKENTVEASAEKEGAPQKSKKERIIEMAKALNSNSAPTDATSSKKKRRDKDGNPVDELIAEIQSSKAEIAPESEAQKQQIEIINQFIRVQPSISNPRDRSPSAVGDLTTIKSGEFGDNIVSETLVEILVKQGKKDRAIEVLKKLIWKYPQKKAYFASQIEDLKK